MAGAGGVGVGVIGEASAEAVVESGAAEVVGVFDVGGAAADTQGSEELCAEWKRGGAVEGVFGAFVCAGGFVVVEE